MMQHVLSSGKTYLGICKPETWSLFLHCVYCIIHCLSVTCSLNKKKLLTVLCLILIVVLQEVQHQHTPPDPADDLILSAIANLLITTWLLLTLLILQSPSPGKQPL